MLKKRPSLETALLTLVSITIAGATFAQSPQPATPIAADVESQPLSTTRPSENPSAVEAAWADLGAREPLASSALLTLVAKPDETTALLARELPPLMLAPAQLDALLAALGSEDETIWQPAYAQLQYFDPRLVAGLEDLMERVQDSPARNRLVSILSIMSLSYLGDRLVDLRPLGHGEPEGGYNFVAYDTQEDAVKQRGGSSFWAEHRVARLNTFDDASKPKWTRAVRGIVLLEHIGTPAARAIVDKLATGHPEAQPTVVAKEAIARRKP